MKNFVNLLFGSVIVALVLTHGLTEAVITVAILIAVTTLMVLPVWVIAFLFLALSDGILKAWNELRPAMMIQEILND